MKGSEAKLLGFMEGVNNRYIIPVYQRKYDWKIENCNKLYEDLKKIIRNKRETTSLGESIGVTRRIVQKYINVLKESGRIERVGGKRYGHWKIND